ncbi:hypothetical protein Vadar_023319 [Vaccinium darrowii]|uniref:Uncharacterized protein n=1 Tax=Vaccinium darrowii TaxID=229202 RepID=A0ACB7XSQ7_9ERIC|nr:hypothetical protein Vadar_023319 [Vaccinium darrowii]
MPAAPVPNPVTQVHDWLLQNIASTLEHISERFSAKENGPPGSSDKDQAPDLQGFLRRRLTNVQFRAQAINRLWTFWASSPGFSF